MANINLISARRAERVRLIRLAKGLLVAVVVAGAMGMGILGFTTAQLVLARAAIAETERRLKDLEPVMREIRAAEAEQRALQPKLVTLREAKDRTQRWFDITEGLKRAVPAETWLTSLSVENGSDNSRTLRINGVTVNQSRVGETMYRLTQQTDYYEKVDLRYTQTTRAEERENVEFELAAKLHQPWLATKTGGADAHQAK